MPNLYARATALPNVAGRIDYISNPKRQERLLATYDAAADLLDGQFWKQLAKESQTAFEQFSGKTRNGKELKCCEGREIVIALSNSLLDRLPPDEIARVIADEFREKLGLTVVVGLHLKHDADSPDNLHAHVVFPERELLEEPVIKTAERNLFFDANGKRRYKKSEILDENKQLLPGCRIVKKGEIYEQHFFGSVDARYSDAAWLAEVKTGVILPLRNGKLKGDVEITEYDPSTGKLPLQHVGKMLHVKKADRMEIRSRIEAYNEAVRQYNRLVDEGKVSKKHAKIVQDRMRWDNRTDVLPVMIRQLNEINRKIQTKQTMQQDGDLMDLINRAEEARKISDREAHQAWVRYRDARDVYWPKHKEIYGSLKTEMDCAYDEKRDVRSSYNSAMRLLYRTHNPFVMLIAALWALAKLHESEQLSHQILDLEKERQILFENTASFKKYSAAYREDLQAGREPAERYIRAMVAAINTADRLCENQRAQDRDPVR